MTGPNKQVVDGEIALAVQAWHEALRALDVAVERRFGLTAVERRCLELLLAGERSPSEIARGIPLAPASVTALLDRLEARGYVARTRSTRDRRRLEVAATPKALALALEVRRPLAAAEAALIGGFGAAELWSVIRFLDASTRLRRDFAAALGA